MNNAGLNREQFNDTIKRRTFYSVIEGLFPSKKVNYPPSGQVDYQGPHKLNYPTSKQENYQDPKRIQYPTAKGLFKIKK